jgi:ribonuclease T2
MKITSTITALLLLLLSLGCNSSKSPNQLSDAFQRASPQQEQVPKTRAAAAGQPFDFYLLNLSWSPEFCATHPTAAECAQHRAFTLHGLWPQNNGGTYPENCSNAAGPKNPAQYSDIYPDSGLLRHEWKTHGTCSGLAPDDFFNLARQAIHSVSIPNQLTSLDRQASMPPNQIIDLFGEANPTFPRDSLALSCGNNYLTAVEVCMDKTLKPIACGPIRTCRANTVRIPPPHGAN